jgi:hypothetical protein
MAKQENLVLQPLIEAIQQHYLAMPCEIVKLNENKAKNERAKDTTFRNLLVFSPFEK